MPIKESKAKVKRARKVVIVGVSGYLGSALATGLKNEFEVYGIYNTHPIRFEGVSSAKVDVLLSNEIVDFLNMVEPDCIIYSAGLSFDKSGEDAQAADLLHFKVPSLFFKIYRKPHLFVYLSTDAVYGQEVYPEGRDAFIEKDTPAPRSPYGTTKISGEGVVLSNGLNAAVFRLASVYGEVMGGPYHVRRYWINDIHSKLAMNQKVVAFSDQFRNFVYVGDVVRAVRKYLLAPVRGTNLYHLAGPGKPLSRVELATEFCKAFSLNSNLIKPEPAPAGSKDNSRPKSCGISAQKFEQTFEFKFQPAPEAFKEMFDRMKSGFTKSWP